MERSSHYYAVLALCLLDGIRPDIARRIAHASQFVDDAKINKVTISGPGTQWSDRLFDIATCHSYFKMKTFNYQSMVSNTCLFHFFPGNSGSTFTKKLRCKKDPPILNELITEVLKGVPFNPERLGMLLHVFADTYSHQGFSGLLSIENDIKDLKSQKDDATAFNFLKRATRVFDKDFHLFDKFIPAYGHGQALDNPDIPFREWEYAYDASDAMERFESSGKIINSERFKDAFTKIDHFLLTIDDAAAYASGRPSKERDLDDFFRILLREERLSRKEDAWKELITELAEDCAQEYDEEAWPRAAFSNYQRDLFSDRVVDGAVLSPVFQDSSWCKFVESVHWFKEEAFNRLSKVNLTIPH